MSTVIEDRPTVVPVAEGLTLAAGLSTGPVSTEAYRSPEYYERESERVFGRAWLNMGRIEQLPTPDSYFVKPVEVRKASVLVTRNQAGEVRAFHNVCAHRGNLVVLEPCGKGNRFSCRYHNWTYRNSGELIGVPDQTQFFNLDKKTCGLTPIACDVWEGWVFINFQKKPEVSLKEYLGDMGRVFTDIPYLNTHQALVIEARFKANWKLIADAFVEAYHVPALHPATLAPSFASEKNKYARPVAGKTWGIHSSISTYGNIDYVTPENSNVERLANLNAGSNVLGSDTGEEVNRLVNHPAINPGRSSCWSADLTWVFPNFHIDFSSGGFWTHEFWPTSYNTTRWTASIYMPTAKSWRERLQQEHYAARWGEVVLEDVTNCERIQQGMESGAKDHIILQDGEFMIRHNLHTIDKWVNAGTVAEAMR